MSRPDLTLHDHLNGRISAVHNAAIDVSTAAGTVPSLHLLPERIAALRAAVNALDYDLAYFFAATRAAVLPPPPVMPAAKGAKS
jgi:hypothetical protein